MYELLIADDESIIREGLKSLLSWEELGFHIAGEAAGGEQTLDFMLRCHPDVVLMDINMPGLSGLEVLKRAKEKGFTGNVIFLSGYSDFKYAQEAIRLEAVDYLTKPVDEEELGELLAMIRTRLDEQEASRTQNALFREKARDAILRDLILGETESDPEVLEELGGFTGPFQIVLTEKFGGGDTESSYDFAELLRVTNQENRDFETLLIEEKDCILLKTASAQAKFRTFLDRFELEEPPQSGSPLDSLFFAYGPVVHRPQEIPDSYRDARLLLSRRFFCDQGQHTVGYDSPEAYNPTVPVLSKSLLESTAEVLLQYIQAFNRNEMAQTLHQLQRSLYPSSDSLEDIRLFLSDLFLCIKEEMSRRYRDSGLTLPGNAEIIRTIHEKNYLYEIILFFSEQFEIMMSSIGNSSRDSILGDVLHYIDHNYAGNITLENIAPLFGYNSSYLGKIFSRKMGENFNTYVDKLRISRAREMLLQEDLKVYAIAEAVGYRNVDYFHIKFKKYVGMSPAEYRKANRTV
jgi:two-component system response regulator YesN